MSQLVTFSFRGVSLVTDAFIETGTGRGKSLFRATKAGFKKLDSIEVCPRLHAAASKNVSGLANVHLGSGPVVLPAIMDRSLWTTFFLDSHFRGLSRDEVDPQAGQCPLLAELSAIRSVPWVRLPIILIDDWPVFTQMQELPTSQGFDQSQWPSAAEVLRALPDGTEAFTMGEMLLVAELGLFPEEA